MSRQPTFALRGHFDINAGQTQHSEFVAWDGKGTRDIRDAVWFDHGQAVAISNFMGMISEIHGTGAFQYFRIVSI